MSTGIVYMKPQRVFFARARGPYATSAPAAWGRLIDWLEAKGARRDVTRGYGLVRDNARTVQPELCRYDACIEAVDWLEPDEQAGIGEQSLPFGTFARHRHKESLATMGDAFSWIIREWAPGRGVTLDETRPLMEVYLNDPRSVEPGRLRLDLCVPVVAQRRRQDVA